MFASVEHILLGDLIFYITGPACKGSPTKTLRMIKFLFAALLMVSAYSAANAQFNATAKQDAAGNYKEVKPEKQPATIESLTKNAEKTGKTFEDKTGEVFPIYKSATGKLFYVATSKAGNLYRRYIKVD